jgi:hypothetical protein
MYDAITRAALDYLNRRYGMEPGEIQRISVESSHDDLTRLTVTVIVRREDIDRTREVRVPLLRTPMLDETQRIDLGRPSDGEGSHAPQRCAICDDLIEWRIDEDPGRWRHVVGADSIYGHAATPAQ